MMTSAHSRSATKLKLKDAAVGFHARPESCAKFTYYEFACQGISCGGSQGGLDDPRSSLLRKVFETFDKIPADKRSGSRVLTSSCEHSPRWPGS